MSPKSTELYKHKVAEWRRDNEILLVRALVDPDNHGLHKATVAEITGHSLSTVKRWCKKHAYDHIKGDGFIAEGSSLEEIKGANQ
jgi:hypothetical protein